MLGSLYYPHLLPFVPPLVSTRAASPSLWRPSDHRFELQLSFIHFAKEGSLSRLQFPWQWKPALLRNDHWLFFKGQCVLQKELAEFLYCVGVLGASSFSKQWHEAHSKLTSLSGTFPRSAPVLCLGEITIALTPLHSPFLWAKTMWPLPKLSTSVLGLRMPRVGHGGGVALRCRSLGRSLL